MRKPYAVAFSTYGYDAGSDTTIDVAGSPYGFVGKFATVEEAKKFAKKAFIDNGWRARVVLRSVVRRFIRRYRPSKW